jgi:hypothetical protein
MHTTCDVHHGLAPLCFAHRRSNPFQRRHTRAASAIDVRTTRQAEHLFGARRGLNVSEAAEALHTSQPGVSAKTTSGREPISSNALTIRLTKIAGITGGHRRPTVNADGTRPYFLRGLALAGHIPNTAAEQPGENDEDGEMEDDPRGSPG